ncbi:MAG TPA: hypothetical protein VJA22_00530, partial [Patescibacteria group bacterium]|nr:hypothetical protein [Patescibacteria group bacterium]
MKRMFVHEVGRDEHGTIIEYFRNRSGSTESVVPYDGTVYSRMKHGDPIAIETAARELFTRLLSDEEILCSLIRDRFAITNDTRLVPTASFTIMQVLVEKFLKPFLITHGTDVVWVTSCRKGAISEGDYGKLCESERKKRMAKRHP